MTKGFPGAGRWASGRLVVRMRKAPGYRTFQGLPIHIEHDVGDTRSGVDGDGQPWSVRMGRAAYGEIVGTTGADGDPLDVFIGPNAHAPFAYVVQAKLPGNPGFDETKSCLGFNTRAEAEAAFRSAYNRPGFLLSVTTWPMPSFLDMVRRHPALQRGRLDAAALAQVQRMAKANKLKGGAGDDVDPDDLDPEALAEGVEHEREHTDDPDIAREIATDHLSKDKHYYRKLKRIEKGIRRILAKARVKAHQRKLKDGRTVAVKEHQRKDAHPHDALRRAVLRTVVDHGTPMPIVDLTRRLPKKHRNVDPKVLEQVVGDMIGFGLLTPHGDGVVPGHRPEPERPAAPRDVPDPSTAMQLMLAWRDHPEARPGLERVMLFLGMQRLHAPGEVVPFDGIRHDGPDAWPDDPVEVEHPGWVLPTADGFDRVLERAKVRPANAPPELHEGEHETHGLYRDIVEQWHQAAPDVRPHLERAMAALGLERTGDRWHVVAGQRRVHVPRAGA